MKIDHIDVERTVHHLTALAGIDTKPAACGDIGALFETDRRFHPEAGAVAQRELGPC